MEDNYSFKQLHLPFIIWATYSLMTVAFFAFGPYDYDIENPTILYLYLFGVHMAVFQGYRSGLKLPNRITTNSINIYKILVILFIPVTIYITILLATGTDSAYGDSTVIDARLDFNERISSKGSLAGHSLVIFGSVVIPFLALAFIYRKLSGPFFYVGFILCLSFIFFALKFGKRGPIYGVLVWLIICLFAASYTKQLTINRLTKVVIFLFFSGLIVFFLLYASVIANSGVGRAKEELLNYVSTYLYESSGNEITLKKNQFVYDLLPIELAPAYLQGTFYYGHSYLGLHKCLTIPKDMIAFGTAHADVINRTLADVFDVPDIRYTSYFNILTDFYDYPKSSWITLYAWVASDVGFIGSLVIFYYLGLLLANSWKSMLYSFNPYASIVVVWLFYIFMQTHYGFSGDYGSVLSLYGSIWYYFNHTKYSDSQISSNE